MSRGIRKPKVFSVVTANANGYGVEVKTMSEAELIPWLADNEFTDDSDTVAIFDGAQFRMRTSITLEPVAAPEQKPTEKKPRKKREPKNGAPTVAGVLDGKNGKGEEKTA